jgi:hypothetical protein
MIRDNFKLLHVWYLDDATIVRDLREVAKALDIIWEKGPGLGRDLNICKTEIFWPSCDGVVPFGYWETDVRGEITQRGC